VIDTNGQFVLIPSLIWMPFGRRTPRQIAFPLLAVNPRRAV